MSKTKKHQANNDFQSWLKRKITLRDIESGAPNWYNNYEQNKTGRGLAAIYRQEIIEDVSFFTSQSVVRFYDKLFSVLDFELPRHDTGRKGFPKEAMLCAFIVMKCEGFSQITDLADYLESNRIIAHYCGFNIMRPLPSYWTYSRFLKRVKTAISKKLWPKS